MRHADVSVRIYDFRLNYFPKGKSTSEMTCGSVRTPKSAVDRAYGNRAFATWACHMGCHVSEGGEVAVTCRPRRHSGVAAQVRRLAGATRHGKERGWYQKNEGDALNLMLPFAMREWGVMADGEGRAPAALGGRWCEHGVEPDRAKPLVGTGVVEDLQRRRNHRRRELRPKHLELKNLTNEGEKEGEMGEKRGRRGAPGASIYRGRGGVGRKFNGMGAQASSGRRRAWRGTTKFVAREDGRCGNGQQQDEHLMRVDRVA